MLLLLVLLLFFSQNLTGIQSKKRRQWIVAVSFLYLAITTVDWLFLYGFLGRPFHFSDPTNYYDWTVNIPFKGIFQLEHSSNVFYLIVNWIYNHIYEEPYLISIFIRLDNIFVFLIAYMLLTRDLKNFGFNDLLILLNPYLILMLLRNVRDAYILLFIGIVLLGLGVIRNVKHRKWYLLFGLIMIGMTRSILLLVFGVIYLLGLIRKKRALAFIIVPAIVGLIVVFSSQIIGLITNQALSAMEAANEDAEEMAFLIGDGNTLTSILPLLKRFVVGTISLILTPHPINFYTKWVVNADSYGSYGIYTAIDNLLILTGAILCYCCILPRFIYFMLHPKQDNSILYQFTVLYILIYVVAFLGITDIRNRYLIYFFILIDFIRRQKGASIKPQPFYYVISFILFITVAIISN